MPDPNNIVLTQHPIVFMLIPKVANTSIKMAMLNAVGIFPAEPSGLNHYMARKIENQAVFQTVNKQALVNQYRDHLKIAFVRNPFDRIISCYKNKVVQTHHRSFERYGIHHGCTLKHFISAISRVPDDQAEQHFRSQYYELYHNDELVPDYVGRFEHLQADWFHVKHLAQRQLGLELPDLPHVNRSPAMHIDVPDDIRASIARRYADDFRAFDYD